MSEEYYDIWRRYGFTDEDDPNAIIREVDLNMLTILNDFITNIEINSPTLFILGGRKAAHLISRYDRVIDEHGYLRCFVRCTNSDVWISRRYVPEELPAIIFLDSIHTGTECEKLIRNLNDRAVDMKKIVCYLLDENGLNNVLLNKIVDRDIFNHLYSSSSDEEYIKESAKLQVFYRSRIEPMDPDVCFNLYDVNCEVSPEYLRSILKELGGIISKDAFNINISEDAGLATNISEIIYTLTNCDDLNKFYGDIFSKGVELELHGMTIRIKIHNKSENCEFTVIIKLQGTYNHHKYIKLSECLKNPELCALKNIAYKDMTEEEVKSIVCPNCVFQLLSDYILGKLNNYIISQFEKEGHECILKRKYRPLSHLSV